jgi:hypothetical protein
MWILPRSVIQPGRVLSTNSALACCTRSQNSWRYSLATVSGEGSRRAQKRAMNSPRSSSPSSVRNSRASSLRAM